MGSIRSRRGLLVAVGTILALGAASACSSSNDSGSSGSSGGAKGKKVRLITGVKSDPFYITMTCAAQQEAKAKGMDFTADGSAQWDVSVQRPLLDSVAAARPDGLLISPVDTSALTPSLKQIQSSGTKVALVDTTVTDTSIGITRISSDNEKGGRVAADALAKLMNEKGSVIVISVKPGVSTTDARIKGFTEEMGKYPDIKVLPTLYDNDLPATAASQIQSTLAAHPDLGGVFAGNTNTGTGIATGLKQAGKQGAVKVAAFDAEPDEVAALKANTLQVLVAQDPAAIGRQAVDQLANAFEGKSVGKSIGTDMVAITKDNMGDPSVSKYFYKSQC
ncbi:monosaccharide ABC transporter substrate-binding protein (CUT2 family) [Streptomyces sp. Ag109_O5-1]|uniref:ABC transporter substrate-binding protein n=1 Tax=Streptomyces sp. Ag109_O5-1 TaxID=1938851 RepID=UPI000F5008A4|nr:ABC transporter substrate-binding protein [Streptomyces sp. Ag109_O5-1]RPE39454.1 monosaccharide ABC transporter substrate-binding protein (CUT2 family) [Streptomyces sp. Ag109_O5-1]